MAERMPVYVVECNTCNDECWVCDDCGDSIDDCSCGNSADAIPCPVCQGD